LQGSEKAVVARHEAGHAVVGTAVANILTGQPRVEVINITGTLTVWCRFLYLLLFTVLICKL
jgi:ATP-dependent Zn protease